MAKSSDEIKELQRSINRLQRSDGAVLQVGGRVYLLPLQGVADPDALLALLARETVSEAEAVAGLARGCRLDAPARWIDGGSLGVLQRDLRILEKHPDLAGLTRQAPRFFRGQVLDRDWLAARRVRLDRLQEQYTRSAGPARALPPWEAALTLARSLHGDETAEALEGIRERSTRSSLEGRSPGFQERLTLCLARYGLLFPPAPGGALRLDKDFVRQSLESWPMVRERLAGFPLRLDQVVDLLALPVSTEQLGVTGRWVSAGMELPLLREIGRLGLLGELIDRKWGVETARAYCGWVTRLAPHYQRQGIQLALTPEAFERLREAKREELAVLGLCLLEHHGPSAGRPTDRQIALLDATLAMFQKVPDRARLCLEGLESTPAGLAAAICPDFAAWLEHDPHLDRYLHLCGLLGVPRVPSKSLLRDFESVVRRTAELAYLSSLPGPNEAQRRRIAQLERADPPPGPGWTKRRLAERNEALAAEVLERRIDQALAEILRHAFGLSLPRITPAWRDVFRFFLSTDDNRELLGVLLRNATATPGRYFPPTLPRNREWLKSAGERMSVEAWLRPRRRTVELDGKRYTLEVEEDPIEVLRMGIPFQTCLSLQDGFNAAATVLNALDVNKRVLYLKDGAGTLVARQLIAVSQDFALLRYRLYSSLPPERGPELEVWFRGLCEEIAREAGLPLGDSGEPGKLHKGFWYDDGVEPFGVPATSQVQDYCRSLGLSVPPVVTESLRDEAELWRAAQARDAGRFERAIQPWSDSLGAIELGRLLVRELGPAKLAQRFRAGAPRLLPVILRHRAEQGTEAMLRAARRLIQVPRDGERTYDLLRTLPMTPAAMKEMASLALHLRGRSLPFDEHAIEHGTMYELPRAAEQMKVAQLLDLCDRLAPVWDWVVAQDRQCADCRATAENAMLAVAARVFLRDPDTRPVVACLRSKRSSELAQRVALRILGRFPFPRQSGQEPAVAALTWLERAPSDAPWARQALRELAARRPGLARSPEMAAAWLRQGASVDLSAWPVPDEPPFQELGDLALHVPELLSWLAEHFGDPGAEIHDWRPGIWELHMHSRRVTAWRKRLVREVEERRKHATQALRWLKVLGDQESLDRLQSDRQRRRSRQPGRRALRRGEVDAALLRQALGALWRERSALPVAAEETHPEVAEALAVLDAANLPLEFWLSWLAEIREQAGGALGPLLLDGVGKWLSDAGEGLVWRLTPDLVLWLWSFPSLRAPLLGVLGKLNDSPEIRRLHLSLLESARVRSLDPRELLESWAVALLDGNHHLSAATTGDRTFLELVVRAALSRTSPEHWLRLYDWLPDPLSASLFLAELARQPEEKREELRILLRSEKESDRGEDHQMFRFWLERALKLPMAQEAQSWTPERRISAAS